jgi:fermentation-respiration switch protein FrsA (DUF1100 family)
LILQVILVAVGVVIGAIAIYLVLIAFVLDLSVPAQPLERGAADEDPVGAPPTRDVRFEVDGTALRGWLFLPQDTPAPFPCIVMAHGFGGTRDCGLDRYAGRFRKAGFAVLAFDYRHFGASEGEPRQLYWNPLQLEDWSAAVAYARGLDEVDASRIALWGSSASGGHVIVTAAKDPEIVCVSAQCPGLDPRHEARGWFSRLGPRRIARLIMHAQRDMARSRFGLSPHKIPIVGRPGTVAFFDLPDAYAGYSALAPEGFVNEVCARIVLRAGVYRPIEHAKDVRCPVLLQICEQDELVAPETAEATAEELGALAGVERYPIGHFDIYHGAPFEIAVRDQLAFFKKHL